VKIKPTLDLILALRRYHSSNEILPANSDEDFGSDLPESITPSYYRMMGLFSDWHQCLLLDISLLFSGDFLCPKSPIFFEKLESKTTQSVDWMFFYLREVN